MVSSVTEIGITLVFIHNNVLRPLCEDCGIWSSSYQKKKHLRNRYFSGSASFLHVFVTFTKMVEIYQFFFVVKGSQFYHICFK